MLHRLENKPYFNGILIKLGMAAALPLHTWWSRRAPDEREEVLMEGKPPRRWRLLRLIMLFPALTDIATGVFDMSSLLMLPTSV